MTRNSGDKKSANVIGFRKGFIPSERQMKREDAFRAIKMLLRRASVYDALLDEPVKQGGSVTFPGFAFRVNVWFQTEIEAREFQEKVRLIARRPKRTRPI